MSKAEALSASEAWLDARGNTIDLDLDALSTTPTPPPLLLQPSSSFVVSPITGSPNAMANLNADGVYITLIFKDGAPSLSDTPEAVGARLLRIALDKLPLSHSLTTPGWTVIPRTPVSSFRDGVEVEGFGPDGILTLRVSTRAFALSGEVMSGRHRHIADAPMPQDSFFQLRRDIKLNVRVRARIGPPGASH